MKNPNIYKIPNKLVITTKKIILLFFVILNVTSSNADFFSEHLLADSSSLLPNPSIQGQPSFPNAEALKEMEPDEVEWDITKNEGHQEIQTNLFADEEHTTTILPDFKSYVLTLIDKELNIESTKKYHSFLRVYKNIIMNHLDFFWFKIIDVDKFIIASFCSTGPDTCNSDTPDSDTSDSDSSEDIEVGLRPFIKRATKYYYPTQSKNEKNYHEKNAVAAFGDKDSGELIIKFFKLICETAENYCEDESGLIVYGETDIILEKSEKIIQFIRESSETLNSEGQKILYPICYETCLFNDGDQEEVFFVHITELYFES